MLNHINPIILYGEDLDLQLFKIAFHYAELQRNIWFISPKAISKIPTTINIPDKASLKLITFLYLTNYTELVKHLNEIHMWHTIPHLIIISNFEVYINLRQGHIKLAAFVIATLIDACNTIKIKHNIEGKLLFSIEDMFDEIKCLQNIIDIYQINTINTDFRPLNVLEDIENI